MIASSKAKQSGDSAVEKEIAFSKQKTAKPSADAQMQVQLTMLWFLKSDGKKGGCCV